MVVGLMVNVWNGYILAQFDSGGDERKIEMEKSGGFGGPKSGISEEVSKYTAKPIYLGPKAIFENEGTQTCGPWMNIAKH